MSIPSRLRWGETAILALNAVDPSGIARVMVYLPGSQKLGIPMVSVGVNEWRVLLPGDLIRGATLSLWIAIEDKRGNRTLVGSNKAPRIVTVVQPKPLAAKSSAWKQWWFWTLIGTGIAATAVTTYLLTVEPEDVGSYGSLRVGVTWPH